MVGRLRNSVERVSLFLFNYRKTTNLIVVKRLLFSETSWPGKAASHCHHLLEFVYRVQQLATMSHRAIFLEHVLHVAQQRLDLAHSSERIGLLIGLLCDLLKIHCWFGLPSFE